MRIAHIRGAVLFLAAAVCACGRMGMPLPPEDLSPQAVQDLTVVPGLEGVEFQWRAPQRDQRGRPLTEIDGYQIYRKSIARRSDILDPAVEFALVASIPDTHLEVLDELREQAKREGRISRKESVPEEITRFRFTDRALKPGQSYVYKIVPINQGGAEGEVLSLIKVDFRGETSEISLLEQPAERQDLGQRRRILGGQLEI